MNNEEILSVLKPVLNSDLYHEIETVFEREAKLSKAVSLIDSAIHTPTVSVASSSLDYRKKSIAIENFIDSHRSNPKYLGGLDA